MAIFYSLFFYEEFLFISFHLFYLVFSFTGSTSICVYFWVYQCHWPTTFGILGSLFIVRIVFTDTPFEVSCDPCVERIICASKDIGKIVVHRGYSIKIKEKCKYPSIIGLNWLLRYNSYYNYYFSIKIHKYVRKSWRNSYC